MCKIKILEIMIILCILLTSFGCTTVNHLITETPNPGMKEGTSLSISTKIPSVTASKTSIIRLPIITQSLTSKPSLTATKIPLSTLQMSQAKAEIMRLLQEESNPENPSLLGIIPGKTSIESVKDLFFHLGIPLQLPPKVYDPGQNNYSSSWSNNDINFSVEVLQQNSRVKNMKISLLYQYLECFKLATGCDRTIYSPAYFIENYGNPTRVSFYIEAIHDTIIVDGATATPEFPTNFAWYDMIMNYEPLNLIVAYYRAGFISKDGLTVCPLTDPFETVWIWLGENPQNPPYEGVPLEKVTPLTIDQFSTLMNNNDKPACFPLDVEAVVDNQ